MKSLFTPKEVTSVIDVSYRQLQYWDRSQFIPPTMRKGRRKTRVFTFKDLVLLETAVKLRNRGHSVQSLRKIIERLKSLLEELSFPLLDVTIMLHGEDILLFSGKVSSNLSPEDYTLLSVKELREKVDKTLQDHAAA